MEEHQFERKVNDLYDAYKEMGGNYGLIKTLFSPAKHKQKENADKYLKTQAAHLTQSMSDKNVEQLNDLYKRKVRNSFWPSVSLLFGGAFLGGSVYKDNRLVGAVVGGAIGAISAINHVSNTAQKFYEFSREIEIVYESSKKVA